MNMENLINMEEASRYLNVSKETLRRWDREGKLKPLKTPGGHRRYKLSDLEQMMQENLERWDKIGLLKGIEDKETRQIVADRYNDYAEYQLKRQTEVDDIITVAFPIIRRLFCKDPKRVHPSTKELFSTLFEKWGEFKEKYEEKAKEIGADFEVEFCDYICNLFDKSDAWEQRTPLLK